VRQLTV
jgi:hypothetical protein